MSFQDNLQTLRKINHLSQEKLAEKVGVSRQSVSKWETGLAYPEMTNILALCTVFHCKITDLISVNSPDFHALDTSTRNALVKFEQKDRNKLQTTSQILYVIAKILKIASLLSFAILALVTYELRYAILNFILNSGLSNVPEETIETLGSDVFASLQYCIPQILVVIVIFALLIATNIFVYKLFREVEHIFKHIHTQPSPFTLENIFSLKKITKYSILCFALPLIVEVILSIALGTAPNIDLAAVLYILVIFSLNYIFRYGYALQSNATH